MTAHNRKNILPLVLLLSVFFGIVFLMYANQGGKEKRAGQRQVPVQKPVMEWKDGSVVIVSIGGARANAEISATGAKKKLGLGKREKLEENTGMLFVFESAGAHSFWNKDMLFPIDVIWIRDGMVVDVYEKLPDFGSVPNFLVTPAAQANFVLEVAAGFVKAHAVKKGDTVTYSAYGSEKN